MRPVPDPAESDMSKQDIPDPEGHGREYRLGMAVDNAAEVIVVGDKNGVVSDVNAAVEPMFGYTAQEVIGQNISLLMPFRQRHDDYLARYRRTGKTWAMGRRRELPGRRKDGSIFPLELTVTEIADLGLYCAIFHDLSKQKARERDVLHISQMEQERIGREIHDGLGQQLTGISMMTKGLQHKLAHRGLAEAADLERLTELLQHAIEDARAISHGLSPVPLSPDGLHMALRQLTLSTQSATGITCRLETQGSVEITDHACALQLYRIAQEALNNALKHARASVVTVKLHSTEHHLVLSVHDDGSGFRRSNAAEETFGLRVMRYRADTVGADLAIETSPALGTRVRCELPVRANEPEDPREQ